jgi:hypothetical protein
LLQIACVVENVPLQEDPHCPPLHDWPSAALHATPQSPQFALSLLGSRHMPLHAIMPAAQPASPAASLVASRPVAASPSGAAFPASAAGPLSESSPGGTSVAWASPASTEAPVKPSKDVMSAQAPHATHRETTHPAHTVAPKGARRGDIHGPSYHPAATASGPLAPIHRNRPTRMALASVGWPFDESRQSPRARPESAQE